MKVLFFLQRISPVERELARNFVVDLERSEVSHPWPTGTGAANCMTTIACGVKLFSFSASLYDKPCTSLRVAQQSILD